MSQPMTVPGDSLEQRLRSMILSNGTSSPQNVRNRTEPSQNYSSPNHFRGRGGFRGQESSRAFTGGTSGENREAGQARGHLRQSHDRARGSFQDTRGRSRGSSQMRGHGQRYQGNLYHTSSQPHASVVNAQSSHLENVATRVMPALAIDPAELKIKDEFRQYLERLSVQVATDCLQGQSARLDLVPFGSISSGFAMPRSDMDLSLMTHQEIPGFFRALEKALLDRGHGAHLLAKTRVPILKVCEAPTAELLSALRDERAKFDATGQETVTSVQTDDRDVAQLAEHVEEVLTIDRAEDEAHDFAEIPHDNMTESEPLPRNEHESINEQLHPMPTQGTDQKSEESRTRRKRKWYREKSLGPLDFPKEGVGIQCDINTANPLGIHNTMLLRCYSACDDRVRLMVLFVKAWASARQINSSRNGTLSSYGYVLMVLHFLVNIAVPPVCPNLQLTRRTQQPPDSTDSNSVCQGCDVRFWRNETEIRGLAAKGLLTRNRDSLGLLLRNFFSYYAEHHGFVWTKQVISLRTSGGRLTKAEKGWTGAKTVVHAQNEVKNRYLLAIEDPFEIDHNVARTVIHEGIVSIRDEFRRAWSIIQQVGHGSVEDLFQPSTDVAPVQEEQQAKVEVQSLANETSHSSVVLA